MKISRTLALVASFGLLASSGAHAAAMAAVDVADIVTGITNQTAPVTLVATAVLGLHFAVKAFKWIRRASN